MVECDDVGSFVWRLVDTSLLMETSEVVSCKSEIVGSSVKNLLGIFSFVGEILDVE